MLLQELLGIDEEIYFVEESYLAQGTLERTLRYFNGIKSFSGEQRMRLLRVQERGRTLGLLLFNPADKNVPVDFWSVFTGSLAAAPLKEQFEAAADSILIFNPPEKDIELSSESWRDVVNEYYSLMLVSRNFCPGCAVRPESYGSVFSENSVQRVKESLIFFKRRVSTLKGRSSRSAVGTGCLRLLYTGLGWIRWG